MYRYFIGLFTILLIGLGGFYFQSSFAQVSVEYGGPQSSVEFLRWCKSIDTNKREFCEGYIDGMSYVWQVVTACESTRNTDQSFCAGVMAAREKIQNLKQTCENCDYERQKQLNQDLADVIGKCSPNSQVSSSYCEGFSLEVKMRTIDWELNDRMHGLSQGFTDIIISLMFASEYMMPYLPPCIERDAESRRLIASIDAFADDYRELLQLESRITFFLTKALFYGLCPGPREHLSPHMEHCTDWNYKGDDLGVENSCGETISIRFQADPGPVMEAKIKPEERFRTGLSSRKYISTACRPGYVSSVPFSKENWEKISRSYYHCVKE